jgi:uncharacterized damage-inducible protein DinB
MSERIDVVSKELLKTADDAVTMFGGLSAEQLNWRSDEKSWSVAQCFDHLIMTHGFYFPLFDKLASGDTRRSFLERYSPLSGFFGRFLIRSLRPENQKKMKTASKAQPAASRIDGDIIERYREHQSEMVNRLQRMPEDIDLVGTIITSPLLGIVTYSLDDCLTVIVVHGQRHLGQAKRVTSAAGFPA